MTRVLLALLLTAIAPSAALAQTTYEMRQDLSAQVKAEDRKLNTVYKQLTAALGPKAKQALVRSELAWLKFREAEVKAEADRYRGGTFEPVLALNVDIRLLKQRTHELEGWLVQVSNYDDGWSAAELAKMVSEQKGVHAQADHLLNEAYQEYLKLNDAENRQLMTQAELAWIRFRDAEVEFAALAARRKQEAAYGKISALAGVTGTRAQDLGDLVKEIKSH